MFVAWDYFSYIFFTTRQIVNLIERGSEGLEELSYYSLFSFQHYCDFTIELNPVVGFTI